MTIVFIFYYLFHRKKKFTDYFSFLVQNVTEELPLLGLAGLYFLPVGSSVDEVREGKFGPHMASKLIRPQLAFTPH